MSSAPKTKAATKPKAKTSKAIVESDSIIDEVPSARLSKSIQSEDDSIVDEAAPADDASAIESSI